MKSFLESHQNGICQFFKQILVKMLVIDLLCCSPWGKMKMPWGFEKDFSPHLSKCLYAKFVVCVLIKYVLVHVMYSTCSNWLTCMSDHWICILFTYCIGCHCLYLLRGKIFKNSVIVINELTKRPNLLNFLLGR